MELAEQVDGSVPKEVHRQIASASMKPEPFSIKRCLDEYYAFKCSSGVEDRGLKSRINRISKDMVLAFGRHKFEETEIGSLKSASTNATILVVSPPRERPIA